VLRGRTTSSQHLPGSGISRQVAENNGRQQAIARQITRCI
jgi:hypothetical protein